MKVGDLVKMDYGDWKPGDEWGIGVIMEVDLGSLNQGYVSVLWSKLKAISWEAPNTLEMFYENR